MMEKIIPKYVEKYIFSRNLIKTEEEYLQFLKNLTKQQIKAKNWCEKNALKIYQYEYLSNKYADEKYIIELINMIKDKQVIDNYIYFKNLKIKVVKDIFGQIQIIEIEDAS